MHIGIVGNGIVGQTLGLRLVQLGYQVMLGTRDPAQLDKPKGRGPDARMFPDRFWREQSGDDMHQTPPCSPAIVLACTVASAAR